MRTKEQLRKVAGKELMQTIFKRGRQKGEISPGRNQAEQMLNKQALMPPPLYISKTYFLRDQWGMWNTLPTACA